MKKKFKLKDLDCANRVTKTEVAANKTEGVEKATVSFMTQRLVTEASESRFDDIMNQVVAVCKKVEPDCTILM